MRTSSIIMGINECSPPIIKPVKQPRNRRFKRLSNPMTVRVSAALDDRIMARSMLDLLRKNRYHARIILMRYNKRIIIREQVSDDPKEIVINVPFKEFSTGHILLDKRIQNGRPFGWNLKQSSCDDKTRAVNCGCFHTIPGASNETRTLRN